MVFRTSPSLMHIKCNYLGTSLKFKVWTGTWQHGWTLRAYTNWDSIYLTNSPGDVNTTRVRTTLCNKAAASPSSWPVWEEGSSSLRRLICIKIARKSHSSNIAVPALYSTSPSLSMLFLSIPSDVDLKCTNSFYRKHFHKSRFINKPENLYLQLYAFNIKWLRNKLCNS